MAVTYEQYEKISKKYKITSRSSERIIKNKFVNACIELYKIDKNLLHSRIIDNFFENGERVANITKKTMVEYSKIDNKFKYIVDNFLNK